MVSAVCLWHILHLICNASSIMNKLTQLFWNYWLMHYARRVRPEACILLRVERSFPFARLITVQSIYCRTLFVNKSFMMRKPGLEVSATRGITERALALPPACAKFIAFIDRNKWIELVYRAPHFFWYPLCMNDHCQNLQILTHGKRQWNKEFRSWFKILPVVHFWIRGVLNVENWECVPKVIFNGIMNTPPPPALLWFLFQPFFLFVFPLI